MSTTAPHLLNETTTYRKEYNNFFRITIKKEKKKHWEKGILVDQMQPRQES